MKKKSHDADSSLRETMAARIEIKELRDPARENEITNSVVALNGVIEVKIENGALHVSYDPLATTQKKIEQAIRSSGNSVKAATTEKETARPDLPPSASTQETPLENKYGKES
jgi:copper chaperone CopZ